MINKFFLTLVLTSSFILNSCGSNSHPDAIDGIENITESFSLDEKQFLHNLFLTEYLWYDQVTSNIDYAQYNDPQLMINDLRLNPPDEWSFTMTQQEYEDYANQKTAGFGFGYTSDFFIYLVRINAPAYEKLFRGDKILEINGKTATQILITQASQNLNVSSTFTVLRDGSEIDINITPKEYNFKVSLGKIITQGSKKIGYLRYDSFTENSALEIEEAFDNFHQNKIEELVIDLRYNRGGYLTLVSILLENIISSKSGQRQFYLDGNAYFNARHKDRTYYFEDEDFHDGNELNMKRVVFLTTKDSASSSEVIINALKPYLGDDNVVTIGSDTHGKPVGMSGKGYGNNIYFLINFFIRNQANNTTSFDGIATTCMAEDDITHLRGDANETMLKTALYYIENDSCL